MLGIREPEHYGKETYSDLVARIQSYCEGKCEVTLKQSNHEGDLVDYIQSAYFENYDGIVINPGAYTHTSIALLDAVKSVMKPCVEVHISDVNNREEFRKFSYISYYAEIKIAGHGINGYAEAIEYFVNK